MSHKIKNAKKPTDDAFDAGKSVIVDAGGRDGSFAYRASSLGEQLAKDMIAIPIGPPTRLVAVATPGYFAAHTPIRTPHDLTVHDCINIRFLTHGGLYTWEFEKDGHPLNVRVDGRLTFNSIERIRVAVLKGFGIAYLPEDMVSQDVAAGRLQQVLDDWCPLFPGYHLYYPSRRQPSPAFALLVEALRYRS